MHKHNYLTDAIASRFKWIRRTIVETIFALAYICIIGIVTFGIAMTFMNGRIGALVETTDASRLLFDARTFVDVW
jgi:hypothetical protein